MLEQPAEAEALVGDLVAVQRLIHSAGLPECMPDLVGRLISKLADCQELTESDRLEAETLVQTLASGSAILHGDLHPGNVLLSSDGPVVIDWFDASIGHPLADVVRTSLLIRRVSSRTIRCTYLALINDFWRRFTGHTSSNGAIS